MPFGNYFRALGTADSESELLRQYRAGYNDDYRPFYTSEPRLSRMDVPEVSDPTVPTHPDDKAWTALTGKELLARLAEGIGRVLAVRSSRDPGAAAAQMISEVMSAKARRKEARQAQYERERAAAQDAERFNLNQEETEKRLAAQQGQFEAARRDEYDEKSRAMVQRSRERAEDRANDLEDDKNDEARALRMLEAQTKQNLATQRTLRAEAEAAQTRERQAAWLSNVVDPIQAARISSKQASGLPLDAAETEAVKFADAFSQVKTEAQQKLLIHEYVGALTKVPFEQVGEDPVTGKPVYRTLTLEEAESKLSPAMLAFYKAPQGQGVQAGQGAQTQADLSDLRKWFTDFTAARPEGSKDDLLVQWMADQGPEGAQLTGTVAEMFDAYKLEQRDLAGALQGVATITDEATIIDSMRSVSTLPWSEESKKALLTALQQQYQRLPELRQRAKLGPQHWGVR